MIRKGKVIHGLYHLQTKAISPEDLSLTLSQYNSQPISYSHSASKAKDISDVDNTRTTFQPHVASAKKSTTFELWHYRLGHPSLSRLKLIQDTIISSYRPQHFLCPICPLAKQRKLPFC